MNDIFEITVGAFLLLTGVCALIGCLAGYYAGYNHGRGDKRRAQGEKP